MNLSPAHRALIHALARKAVDEHLTKQRLTNQRPSKARPNHASLTKPNKAA